MQKKNLNSPHLSELKRKRRRVFFSKIIIFFFLLLIFLALAGLFSRWKEINIDQIEIVGNKVIDSTLIKKEIEEELSDYYFLIFPRSNVLIYPKNDIKNRLNNTFKRLDNISFNIKDEKTLEVTLSERKAIYTWCGEDKALYSAVLLDNKELENQCYFVDESGYLFDRAPYFSGEVYFKFFGKLNNNKNKDNTNFIGSYFLPDLFYKIITFRDDVSSFGIKPASLFAKEDGDIELYLSSSKTLINSPKIIFKSDADLLKVAENLQAAITTEPLKSDFEKKYSSLLYIDLRFNNKIYYKFE
ncbi:MAG: hypothetical protein AAB636_02570 [Patescibacteria group bacterium]